MDWFLDDRDLRHERVKSIANLVHSAIFKNVFRDSDTFAVIPLVAFATTSSEHFGIFLYLIVEKRSTANTVDINKQYC